MKNIAILTAYQREYLKYDFYFESEQLLRKIFNNNDLEIHYVSPHYYDIESKEFTQHVMIGEEDMHIINEAYKPDLLRVRMGQALYHLDELFADADFLTTPSMRLKHIDADKYQMYRYLWDLQPKSTLLGTYYFYPWLQAEFNNKVVVKPISGSGWYGINFYTREQLWSMEVFNKYSWTESLHMVQNYQNFSGGAPGITDGNHDLRVVFLGRNPSFSMVRVPKKWSLKSNIAAWWNQFSIPIDKIPQDVIALCMEAQERLWIQEPDLYSLDFAYCSKDEKWYLIEMNSSPWIRFPKDDIQYQLQFFQEVADYFQYLIDANRFHKFEQELWYNPGTYAFIETEIRVNVA